MIISDVVDFLKGLSPSELTGIRELQRRDLLQRASIYVTMAGDNTSIDNYGNFNPVDSKITKLISILIKKFTKMELATLSWPTLRQKCYCRK